METVVIFRKFREGDIIAIFPYEIANPFTYTCMSYMHVGQHDGVDYNSIIGNTVPAGVEESQPLFSELESIGYKLRVRRKINRDKFMEAINKSKNY